MMSTEDVLPFEILWCIFENLSIHDLLECRRVCKRWKEAVDTLGNWQDMCEKEFEAEFSHEAHRKSNIPWADLFYSLTLWSDVKSADVEIFVVPSKNAQRFYSLKDNVVAFAQLKNNKRQLTQNLYDSITHFDTEILDEVDKENYQSLFQTYMMNDICTVIEHSKQNGNAFEPFKVIEVFLKDCNKSFLFGKRADVKIIHWFLNGSELYYQTQDHKLYVNKFIRNRKHVRLNTINLGRIFGTVISVTSSNRKKIKVLTNEEDIFSLENGEARHICCLHQTFETVELLTEHGFDWSSPNILPHLSEVCITSYVLDAACKYGKVIITGAESLIRIYHQPFSDGEIDLESKKPEKTIDLSRYKGERSTSCKSIQQIDIVEAINGHKILVLYCGRIIIIRLTYDDEKRWIAKLKRIQKPPPVKISKTRKFFKNCLLVLTNIFIITGTVYSTSFIFYMIFKVVFSLM